MWLRLLLLLSLAVKFTGESDVIGSHEPIEVEVGQDAVLPCHREPPFNVMDLVVEWTCNATEILVHMYRSAGDNLLLQDEKFKDRTSLFHEHIAEGKISLKLTNVTKEDAGNYSCSVTSLSDSLDQKSYVILIVKQVTEKRIDSPAADNNSSTSIGTIIGGIVSAIIAVLAVIIICCAIYKLCRNNKRRPNTPNGDSDTGNGENERLKLQHINIEENEVPQQAPDDRVVEDQQQVGGQLVLPEDPQEVQALLSPLDDCRVVDQWKPEDLNPAAQNPVRRRSKRWGRYAAGSRRTGTVASN